MGGPPADRGGMWRRGIPALDAAAGDKSGEFPHPDRIDAAHPDSR